MQRVRQSTLYQLCTLRGLLLGFGGIVSLLTLILILLLLKRPQWFIGSLSAEVDSPFIMSFVIVGNLILILFIIVLCQFLPDLYFLLQNSVTRRGFFAGHVLSSLLTGFSFSLLNLLIQLAGRVTLQRLIHQGSLEAGAAEQTLYQFSWVEYFFGLDWNLGTLLLKLAAVGSLLTAVMAAATLIVSIYSRLNRIGRISMIVILVAWFLGFFQVLIVIARGTILNRWWSRLTDFAFSSAPATTLSLLLLTVILWASAWLFLRRAPYQRTITIGG